MFQLAALAKAANKGVPVDAYDGFQHPCDHVGQLGKRLLGRREETLKFGDGGRSLLEFDGRVWVRPDGVRRPSICSTRSMTASPGGRSRAGPSSPPRIAPSILI